MMEIFASDLLSSFQSKNGGGEVGVDIALIAAPYFHDKARIIEESGIYPEDVEQVHLTGYDTLIRFLNPKYYPPKHDLSPLTPFLAKHKLRVSYRAGGEWGGKEEQDGWLRAMGEGEVEKLGGRREWVDEGRIVLVDTRGEKGVVSSTKVREAVGNGDKEQLGKLVTKGVGEWILGEGLYREGK